MTSLTESSLEVCRSLYGHRLHCSSAASLILGEEGNTICKSKPRTLCWCMKSATRDMMMLSSLPSSMGLRIATRVRIG
jgi:hypothetical protein